jgi:serine/threonine protein kinase
MKLCPQCESGYPDNLTACPIHGGLLGEIRDLKPGMLVRDTYRIVKKLGQGGMGAVYLADHILLAEPQVLKFLSSELSRDRDFTERFLREVRTLRQIRHKNVVHAGNLEPAEDGTLFFSMEFVDGPDLLTFVRHSPQPFDVREALAITRGIAEGLGAAHDQGMVHRDIKPENILMAPDGKNWVPKIADFGIVATREGHGAEVSAPMLTPYFAAPEQWLGAPAAELDGRTDLYALGGLLFEMLTGQSVFHAKDYQGWGEQHLNSPPRPPSSVRPELADWRGLDTLVLRLLAKHRDDRPRDVAELLHLLDGVVYDPPSEVPSLSLLGEAVAFEPPAPLPPVFVPPPPAPPAPAPPPPEPPQELVPASPTQLLPLRQSQPATPVLPPPEEDGDDPPAVVWAGAIDSTAPRIKLAKENQSRRATRRLWIGSSLTLVVAAFLVRQMVVQPLPSRLLQSQNDAIFAVAFSPNGNTLASASSDGTIQFWDTREAKALTTLRDDFETLAYSPDGTSIASSLGDSTVKLWDPAGGQILVTMQGHTDHVASVAYSPDGHVLASGSWDKTVKLWDVASGKPLRTLTGHTDRVLAVAFSPDGRVVASGSADQTIRLWDAATGQPLRVLKGHTGAVNAVAFSPDDRTLVSGGEDLTVKVWDVPNGGELHTLAGHSGPVRSVAFSPDGRVIASGSSDSTIKLWDPTSGKLLRTLHGHSAAVLSLVFSQYGSLLASAGADKSIRLWSVANVRD